MERRKEEDIGSVIMRFLRQSQLETPLYEHRIIESWGEVAGVAAERMTKDLRIFNQVLHVSLRSAALRNELLYRRTELVKNSMVRWVQMSSATLFFITILWTVLIFLLESSILI